ncbi:MULTISPECIES: FtsW/RodA/SpoVE family cell cycle protein [Bacillus]|uniref:FtsW/RodA/SpoVE family cell cycle protein n=1 Tax=Bacillus TaxID=1386 RepID=UPI000BB6D463|nr:MULTISPECIES: FtsW/RodA/SpoVE family cell cycle protein [Bacillus]
MSSTKFEDFLKKVTSRVKSKEAHSLIKKELYNHMSELRQTYQKEKMSIEDAEEKAIEKMGNAYTLGDQLNKLHKPRMDWMLTILFVLLSSVSFLLLSGGVLSLPASYNFILRQAIWLTLAVIVIVSILFFDYRRLKNGWLFFYVSGFLLLLYTSLFGTLINGARRAIWISDIRLDLTVICLFLLFLGWAGISSNMHLFSDWKKQLLLVGLFWSPLYLFLTLPDFASSIIYAVCTLTMILYSSMPKKVLVKLVAVNGIVLSFFIFFLWQVRRHSFTTRLTSFLKPEEDPYGYGYIYMVLKDVFSQARWLGNGFQQDAVIGQLPDIHTDFAFPYLVYSLGWGFGIVLCFLLLLFIYRMTMNAFKTHDHFGRILVIGASALFALPAVWSILMGLGILPIVGYSLPFITYGGSRLLFYATLLGLVLNVYRRKDIVESTI